MEQSGTAVAMGDAHPGASGGPRPPGGIAEQGNWVPQGQWVTLTQRQQVTASPSMIERGTAFPQGPEGDARPGMVGDGVTYAGKTD